MSERGHHGEMARRERAAEVGADRAREILGQVATDIRSTRLNNGLSQKAVGSALGMSRSQYSRIERGLSPRLSIDTATRALAVLGLGVSFRSYPAGDPIRDSAHVALLERLHGRCHRSLVWRTEVPLPIPGDLRAWDATAVCPACRIGIEAETRLRDVQALERRLALKERDGGMDRLILLLLNSRSNREVVRLHRDVLALRFPVPGARALELLGAGADPGGNALILL